MNKGFKLFIGLGLPYEDHLALEAIAQGSVFMNPKVRNGYSLLSLCFILTQLQSKKTSLFF